MQNAQRRQRGFTLVELLVVIAIISLLATWGLVKIQGAWVDAKKAACEQNLREIWNQLQRYENKHGHMPEKSGSEMIMAVWGDPFLEKSPNNAKILLCPSRGALSLTDANVEEMITATSIHYAGRIQEKPYKITSMSNTKDASKTIIVCDKPNLHGEEPHKGHCLCVLFASGHTGQIDREAFGGKNAQLVIGVDSPVESLKGLAGDPSDD